MSFVLGEYLISGRRATEIAADVERAVSAGELRPGQTLPPLRDLARDLGVNPNTAAAAYRLLRDRGVIETAGRRGSRVLGRPATTTRDAARPDVPPGVRDLSDGNPDSALLPELNEAFGAALRRHRADPVLYGRPPVSEELGRLARASFDADGVPPGPVAVTSGSLDAMERALGAHLRPGDPVAVEDPGWGSVFDVLPALGLRPLPVRMDDEGPLPGDVEEALGRGVRALVVTDRGQNPTGAALSPGRAARLRAVLAGHPEVLVIDDDHVAGLVDQPLCPLAGATRHWMLVRSVAKAYGPDLRLAVLTGDPLTVDRIAGRHRLGPGWVSHLIQDAVVHLWRTGAVDPAAVSTAYGERRGALIAALAERGTAAYGRSGMNVWIPVPDETVAVTRLMAAGWAVAPGARFRLSSGPGIRVTVSTLTPADTAPLADAVAAAVRPVGAGRYA